MPLRNAVQLGYPFELALRSLRRLCDEVVVGVDPTSEDDTLARVKALGADKLVESTWDMSNHDGHRNCEITVQTRRLLEEVSGDWVFSLQADELLHEGEIADFRESAEWVDGKGGTAIELLRLYFYGSLTTLRRDWTLWMVRFFKRGAWKPDVDGAMRFEPIGEQRWERLSGPRIYHYSRVGNAHSIAERVRNLDRFFHPPEAVESGPLPAYDFQPRELDTYVKGHVARPAFESIRTFRAERHPAGIHEWFGENA
jgi:hypothetical protein